MKIVDRFNLASSIRGEARFMIFYEIFERLKNKFGKENSQIKTKYTFSLTKKEKKKLILDLASVFKKSVIKKEEKEVNDRFIDRVSSINYLSMTNQYVLLLKGAKLNESYWLPITHLLVAGLL